MQELLSNIEIIPEGCTSPENQVIAVDLRNSKAHLVLGFNLILCELRKSIKNINQSIKNIIIKITKPKY